MVSAGGARVSLARKRVVICMVTKLDLNMAHPQALPRPLPPSCVAIAVSEMSAQVLLMKMSCRRRAAVSLANTHTHAHPHTDTRWHTYR